MTHGTYDVKPLLCGCGTRLGEARRRTDVAGDPWQVDLDPSLFTGRIAERDGLPVFGQRDGYRAGRGRVRRRQRPMVDRSGGETAGRRALVAPDLVLGVEFSVGTSGAIVYCPNCGRRTLIPSSKELDHPLRS